MAIVFPITIGYHHHHQSSVSTRAQIIHRRVDDDNNILVLLDCAPRSYYCVCEQIEFRVYYGVVLWNKALFASHVILVRMCRKQRIEQVASTRHNILPGLFALPTSDGSFIRSFGTSLPWIVSSDDLLVFLLRKNVNEKKMRPNTVSHRFVAPAATVHGEQSSGRSGSITIAKRFFDDKQTLEILRS